MTFDAAGKEGIRSEIKILACLTLFGTGHSFGDIDASAQMVRQTISTYFHCFCRDVVSIYGVTYLNERPTAAQLGTIESKFSSAGLPNHVSCVDGFKIM